ncbi:prenyltransferase [Theileria orientalis]|uniref:Heme O synthase n=1 Tax=Theileria orientalis TaxID=68886 RepID=A0A976QVN4_THEOR|nr:prenyltransferase [Theileria orientalis]
MPAISRLLSSKSQPLLLNSLKKLSKYKLSLWVTATGASGFLMVSPAISASLLSTCGGIFLCSAAANTFNQIIERDKDALMVRTMDRPLPSKIMTHHQASMIGAGFTVFGGLMLYMSGGLYPMSLALMNIALYTLVYTPLKKKTEWNTHVGSVVGCIPPLIGCLSAGSNLLLPQPWLLFGLMYVWQIPHFYTLSWLYRNDYNKAGFKVYGIDDASGKKTATASMKWVTLLSAFPLFYSLSGLIPPELLFATVFPNIVITHKAMNFYKDPSSKTASSLFVNSLWQILVLMGLTSYYLCNSKPAENFNSKPSKENPDK